MKKLTALFLVCITVYTFFPMSAKAFCEGGEEFLTSAFQQESIVYDNAEIEVAETAEEFSEMSTRMVEENYEENYFSVIVVDTENNTVTTDGEETEVEMPVLNIISGNVADENNAVSVSGVIEEHSTKEELQEIIEQSQTVAGFGGEINPDKETEEKYITIAKLLKQGYEVKSDGNRLIITRPYQTKRLIVRMKDGVFLTDTLGAVSAISDGEGRFVLQFDNIESTMAAYETLKNNPNVSSVSADKVTKINSLQGSVIDKYGFDRWGSKRTETDRFSEYLKKEGKTTSVTVAVLDTGVTTTHELLSGRVASGGYDFVNNDSFPYDDNGHGTHVAGIIVDNTPSNIKVLPLKCFSSTGESTDLLTSLAVEKAIEKGVDVINMSFAGVCEEECELAIAIKKAIKAGIVCVAASGNESASADYNCPANISGCITVGSVGERDQVSYFSNYGNCVDISAPGEDIISSVPDIMGSYALLSGTSMATPFVSAAAAMIKTKEPSYSGEKIAQELKKAVVDAGVKGKDKYYGAGILDLGVYLGDKKAAQSITLNLESVTAYACNYIDFTSEQIEVNVEPFDATDKSFTVSYSKAGVAKYNGFGMIGTATGTTTAKFSLSNGKYDTLTVNTQKSNLWIDYAASSYASGKGTQKEPYLISTAAQLAKIALDSYNYKLQNNTYFKLTKNIDLSGKNWYPILGTERSGYYLRINLDGNGYSISNLKISGYTTGIFTSGAGLFMACAGEIKNLNLKNVDINMPKTEIVGAVAAKFAGFMKNCYVTGSVKGRIAGGLVGDFSTLGATTYSMGISNCRSDVSVTGEDVAGGVCGAVLGGVVNNCIFGGKLYKNSEYTVTGGICAALSSTNALSDAAGSFAENTLVTNCISVSNIVGGRLDVSDSSGSYSAPVTNCYYSGAFSNGIANDFSLAKATTKRVSASKFAESSFFTTGSNWNSDYPWDMTGVWKISSTLPAFNKQKDSAKTTAFDYVDLGSKIVVSGYSGTGTTVKIPSSIDGKPVRYIDSFFMAKNAKVKTLVIPDSVRVIAPYAFISYNFPSLQKITLGSDVRMIAPNAFEGLDIGYITFPESLEIICASAFSSCKKLQYVFFNGSVGEHFSKNAFLLAGSEQGIKVYCPSGNLSWTLKRFEGVDQGRFNSSKAVAIYAKDITTLKVGKTSALTATVLPESCKATVSSYTSSDTSVATVSKEGKITPKKKGTVTITFKSSDGNAKTTKSYTIKSYAPYTVVFNGNGATSGENYTQSLPYGTYTLLTANKFKKTGYTFAGWSKTKDGEVKYSDKHKVSKLAGAGKKITLYAVWKANTYNVKFDANGGSGKMSTQKGFTYGVKKALNKNTFKAPAGMHFAGWSKTKDGKATIENGQKISKLTSKNGATYTLYAVWEKNTYNVKFDANGGSGKMSTQKGFTYGVKKALNLNTFKAPEGMVFAGWSKTKDGEATIENGQKISKLTSKNAATYTLYAVWVPS